VYIYIYIYELRANRIDLYAVVTGFARNDVTKQGDPGENGRLPKGINENHRHLSKSQMEGRAHV